ncbi:MAG: hypothetical protein QW091_00760 [Candidatus Micrarchaeaceae archaeon]
MSILGNSMIIIGIVILVATLYLAYKFYISIAQATGVPLGIPTTNSSIASISTSINGLVSGLLSSSDSLVVFIVKILVLFLFANVGYKFVSLGISQNKASAEIGEAEGTNKRKQ